MVGSIADNINAYATIINDPNAPASSKTQAIDYLNSLKRKTWASDALAVYCAIGASLSSMTYLMAMRSHPLAIDGWITLPIIVGMFVAGAAWYTYRHDTADLVMNPHFVKTQWDLNAIAALCTTVFVLAFELAIAGYGVHECLKDVIDSNTEIALIAITCFASFLPEFAQTYKYLDKAIDDEEEYHLYLLKDPRFTGYIFCSAIMLFFSGMAIYPLLDNIVPGYIAIPMIFMYTGLSMPCSWKKAEMQIMAPNKPDAGSTLDKALFTGVRFGNTVGELAFSAYGFFETLKAFHFINKPMDILHGLDDPFAQAWKHWTMLVCAVAVGICSCVGSYLMTADGNQESYRTQINRVMFSHNKSTTLPSSVIAKVSPGRN